MSCDMAAALCIGISTAFGIRKAVKMRNGGEHKIFGAAMLITQPLIWVASLWKQLRFGSDAALSLGLYIAGITIEGAALGRMQRLSVWHYFGSLSCACSL